MWFGAHPHNDMEIISIPLDWDLKHQDNIGNSSVIKHWDVQVMSAGSGVVHSEYNASQDHEVKLLQIWVIPDKTNVTPRYDQITLNLEDRHNTLQQIVSPNSDDKWLWIHQNAWFHLGRWDQDLSKEYHLQDLNNNWVYIFVISWQLEVDRQLLGDRDGYGIWETENISLIAKSDTEFLIMEVPMI